MNIKWVLRQVIFFSVEKEWPEKAWNVLYNIWSYHLKRASLEHYLCCHFQACTDLLFTQQWCLVLECFLSYKYIWLWNIKNSILYKIIQNIGIKQFLENDFSSGLCSWVSRSSVSTFRTYALLHEIWNSCVSVKMSPVPSGLWCSVVLCVVTKLSEEHS
jgi:hypothetical protein